MKCVVCGEEMFSTYGGGTLPEEPAVCYGCYADTYAFDAWLAGKAYIEDGNRLVFLGVKVLIPNKYIYQVKAFLRGALAGKRGEYKGVR